MNSILARALTTGVLLLSLAAAGGAIAAEGDKTFEGTEKLRAVYDQVHKVDLDLSRAVAVENLVIERDITKITLQTGKIWLAKPAREGEAPTGAWFSGQGRIQMTPPIKIEKDAFKKAMDKDALDETFTRGFIRFTDGFFDQVKDRLAADSGAGDEPNRLFKDRQKELEELNFSVEFPIISDASNDGARLPFFLFEFETAKHGWIAFYYSKAGLPAGLLGESAFFLAGKWDYGETPVITVFHDKADYESGRDLGHEDRDQIWMRDYKGEFKIDKEGLILKAKLDMQIEAMVDGLRALNMGFMSYWGKEANAFDIERLTDAAGQPLDYLHRQHQLLVVLPKALKKGEKTVVHIEYTADYIRPDPSIGTALDDPGIPAEAVSREKAKLSAVAQDYATFTLLNTYPWFPQSGFLKRHTFDWTIKVPSLYVAVASGTTKKRWTEEGYNCLQTVETTPVALASVIFGRYIEKSDTSAKPVINVYTLAKQQKQAESLLSEARTIVTEYSKWFGPYPFDELDIAQMGFFYGFGQAPPGLVQLTGEAFLPGATLEDIVSLFGGRGLDPSFVRAFVAHEIGHEWWGHAVSWANPNDQWLSESYTEYCSALYVQSTSGQKAFDAKLKTWRDRASRTKDAGPIWLGSRLGKDYTAQTYEKGPYVVHMFRLALQTQAVASGGTVADGDRMFFDSLKNFMERFQNKNATTVDFQRVVKETTKVNMDWFFDEWFRGNHWLNIEFKYEVRPTEDGKFLLTATFRQPDKDNVKTAIIPMDIHIGKDKVITKPVYLQKAEQTIQIKLPVNPDKVVLDGRNDVLADIKYL